jgi:hypothetical protein
MYERLHPVAITFIHTSINKKIREAGTAVNHASLMMDTSEQYSDLLHIYEVYVPIGARSEVIDGKLKTFCEFFAIDSREGADKFSSEHQDDLGRKLISRYNLVTIDSNALSDLEKGAYIMGRDFEAELEENAQFFKAEGKAEGEAEKAVEDAIKLIRKLKIDVDTAMQILETPQEFRKQIEDAVS